MRKVALDLGKKKTTYCEMVGEKMIRRTVGRVTELEDLLGKEQPEAVVAIEACREAWYVHDLLTGWGNQVVLVDTTRSRQLGIGQHGRKTDRLDAEALVRALDRGAIPIAHVLSPARRELRRCLSVRRTLVETRANGVATVRGLAREQGETLPDCETENFTKRVREVVLPPALAMVIEPQLKVLEEVNLQLAVVEQELLRWVEKEPLIVQLATAPGVGAVVAAAFVSVIDEAGRFQNAHHVESYIGLVPTERSSGGEKRRLGSITKKGNRYLRALLTQAAWVVIRNAPENDPLKLWANQVAERRGNRIAVIALARRLVGVLWAMWRDGSVYDPAALAQRQAGGVRRAKRELTQQETALDHAHQEALKKARRKGSFQRLNRLRRNAG